MTARKKPAADPAPATTDVVAMVPLSQLYLHPLNVRTEPPPADIEALAESIRAIGLLQNLSGYADMATDPPGHPVASIGIVAGGRRLRALKLIAGDADPMVPVRLTADEATARLWASAENTARMNLHPADEITAYGRMAKAGAAADAIARAFAVTEAHVRRRLKLADLREPALQALRANRITLDQAAALTLARDDTAAERALEEALNSQWPMQPDRIRAMLQQATVPASDRRAVFVGLDAYQDAGGEVQADLFTDRTVLLDANLLDRLFAEKLEAAAEAERAKGWKWVETAPTVTSPWDLPDTGMTAIHRVAVALPEADQDELDELQRLGEVEEWTPEQEARFEELAARAAGDFSDDDLANAGVFLFVSHKGHLFTTDPFRRREDDPARATAAAEDGTVETRPVETKALPQSLLDDLHRIRRAALEVELVRYSGLMLDVLAWSILGDFWPHQTPVTFSATPANITPEKPDGFDAPQRLSAFTARDFGRNTPTIPAFREWRAKNGGHDILGDATPAGYALALAIARCLRPGSPLETYCASLVDPDVRAIWTPTKDGYFARLPVPVMDRIWAELVGSADASRRWATLKKGQKAQELHDLFNSADYREALGLSRETNATLDTWLPPELQWPEVETEAAEAA